MKDFEHLWSIILIFTLQLTIKQKLRRNSASGLKIELEIHLPLQLWNMKKKLKKLNFFIKIVKETWHFCSQYLRDN